MQKKHLIFGTAGHIDHGKSALVKSLTGVDPDRLKEEKERGMTTDLGFAFYGDHITIIDVPGHEKFVRHMVAGASTLDFVMLVIAADDGVMLQTREHLEILKLLEIKKGCVVVTKIDVVDPEWLELVIADIKALTQGTFLENAPLLPVSNITGQGIDTLKKLLDEQLAQIESRADTGVFRLPIDRCFTIKGFGTVVAGTILSGRIQVGDSVELLPSGKILKIRGIQVHNQKMSESEAGFRVAINLVGVEKEEIERGDILAQPGFFQPTLYMNASLYLIKSAEKPLKNFSRIRIHIGTKEFLGRIVFLETKILKPGEKTMVQFRLEGPAVADISDRYVIRTYSPQFTIGGGVIVDPKATKVRKFDEKLIEHLKKLENADPSEMIEEFLHMHLETPRKIDEIAHALNLPPDKVKQLLQILIEQRKVFLLDELRGTYFSSTNREELKVRGQEVINKFHQEQPTSVGMPVQDFLKALATDLEKILGEHVIKNLIQEKKLKNSEDHRISRFDFKVVLDQNLDDLVQKIEALFLKAGYTPPDLENILELKLGSTDRVKKAYQFMLESGKLVTVEKGLAFHKKMIDDAKENIIAFLRKNPEIRVSDFRDLVNSSRRYTLPLLIYFDKINITVKQGEVRVLNSQYKK